MARLGLLCLVSFLVGASVGMSAPFVAAQEGSSEVDQLLEEGKDLFKQALQAPSREERKELIEKAAHKLTEALAKHPTPEQVLRWREEATWALLVEMMTADAELRYLVLKILAIAERRKLIEDPASSPSKIREIKRLVGVLGEPRATPKTLFTAMLKLINEYGQYFLPYCVEVLTRERTNEFTVNVIALIRKLEQDATLAVLAMMDARGRTPEEITKCAALRRNAALLLTWLADWRATGTVREHMETDEDDNTRQQCQLAFSTIAAQWHSPQEFVSVKEKVAAFSKMPPHFWYAQVAKKYYRNDVGVVVNLYDAWLFWYWDASQAKWENRLRYKKVSALEFNEWLAEDQLYRALNLKPDYEYGWALLLCTLYQAFNEVNSAWRVAVELQEHGKVGATVLRQLERAVRLNEKCHTLAFASGPDLLFEALNVALGEKKASGQRVWYEWANPDVAVSILEALRDMGATQGRQLPGRDKIALHKRLLEALDYPEKRVRYAAAEAICWINPRQGFFQSATVVRRLREALRERDFYVILLIFDPYPKGEPRPGYPAPNLTGVLNQLKQRIEAEVGLVIVARSGKEGMSRAKTFPPFDAIVVSTELHDVKEFEVIDELKAEDQLTKTIPVLVVTSPDKLNSVKRFYMRGGPGGRRAEDVASYEDSDSVVGKLKQILQRYTRPEVKRRAWLWVSRAAQALARIDLDNPNFAKSVVAAVDDLCNVIRPPEEQVPISKAPDWVMKDVMRALGHLAGMSNNWEKVLLALGEVFEAAGFKPDVKRVAAEAIGDILKFRKSLPEDVRRALVAGVGAPTKKDYQTVIKMQKAAARALGLAKLSYHDRFDIFRVHRVHKGRTKKR